MYANWLARKILYYTRYTSKSRVFDEIITITRLNISVRVTLGNNTRSVIHLEIYF